MHMYPVDMAWYKYKQESEIIKKNQTNTTTICKNVFRNP